MEFDHWVSKTNFWGLIYAENASKFFVDIHRQFAVFNPPATKQWFPDQEIPHSVSGISKRVSRQKSSSAIPQVFVVSPCMATLLSPAVMTIPPWSTSPTKPLGSCVNRIDLEYFARGPVEVADGSPKSNLRDCF